MLLGRLLADIVSLIGPTLRPIPKNSYLAVHLNRPRRGSEIGRLALDLSTNRTCSSRQRGRRRTRCRGGRWPGRNQRDARGDGREGLTDRVGGEGAGRTAVLLQVHVETFHLQRDGRGAEEVQEGVGRESVLDAAADSVAGLEVVRGHARAELTAAAGAVGEAAGGVHRVRSKA